MRFGRFMLQTALLGAALLASSVQAQVVISQVYGAGGNTGATYNRDFVELFNRGSGPVSLNGLTVQYASATGTGNFTVGATLPNINLAPGQYHLVGMSSGANGAPLPTVDTSGTSSMATAAGKVVLVNGTTALACNGGSTPCSAAQLAQIVDLVGYGAANFFEGTGPTPAPSAILSVFRGSNGCTDTNQNSSDFTTALPAARNSASPLATCGASQPVLSINDVSVFEGDSGTSTASFTVTLNAPAGVGGVSFNIATADGTASSASDYLANALSGQSIAAGLQTYTFNVSIVGDTTSEANETFFVNVSNVSGALAGDAQGQGTIQNDDVNVVQIHDIQGSGLSSPLVGAAVTTEGIVTAQKFNNGFFLQTVDASVDANPATSQGIFVFTSTAPPATAAVGNRIRVTGTVAEFTPSTNLNQLSITQIASVTSIQVLSTGNPLPTPIALTSADFGAASTTSTAERLEGMRVSVANAVSIDGSDGNITESSATSSTTGVFHVALQGVNRPYREPGIGLLDVFPIPGGKTPPRFDTNPERLMVRSRGQVGATAVAVDAGTQVSGMTGVLDYFSGTWALLPDNGTVTVSGGKTPTATPDPAYDQITIGAFNLLRFFDEVNNANGAPTLQAAALDKRLTKTSLAICDSIKAPDILGVVEVENLRVLGLLADRINSTCPRAPQYVPYLVQGNDQGGINVGFLVSNRLVGAYQRVEVLEVTQYGKDTLLTNPDSSTSLLNDRPPLLLRAVVRQDIGSSFPVTVIVNHLRSLNGVDDTGPGSSGWASEGHRVRAKRGQQALFLAQLVHDRQQADPSERIVLLGDFNAFEFNDGYTDVLGIIRGNEAPDAQVITYLDSPITAPLIDGSELTFPAAERYSYVFAGSAQTLDHVLVNEPVVMDVDNLEVHHARINADFGVHHFGTAGTPLRTSDHDPVVLTLTAPQMRDYDVITIEVSTPNDFLLRDRNAVWTVDVTNAGSISTEVVDVAINTDFGTEEVEVGGAGWHCQATRSSRAGSDWHCRMAAKLGVQQSSRILVRARPGATAGRNKVRLEAAAGQLGRRETNNANNTDSETIRLRDGATRRPASKR